MWGNLVMPLVRHGMTTAAGYLVGAGLLDSAMTDTFIGAGLAIVALVMSYLDPVKKKA